MSVGNVGVVRAAPKPPQAIDPALGLLAVFGENAQAAREWLAEVRDVLAVNERTVVDLRALIADADRRKEAAEAAEAAARAAQAEQAEAHRRNSAALEGQKRDLAGERSRHDANVTAKTAELAKTLDTIDERRRQAIETEAQNIARAAVLDARQTALDEREKAIAVREQAAEAQKARILAAVAVE